jgi:glucose uptake protein GlcU
MHLATQKFGVTLSFFLNHLSFIIIYLFIFFTLFFKKKKKKKKKKDIIDLIFNVRSETRLRYTPVCIYCRN